MWVMIEVRSHVVKSGRDDHREGLLEPEESYVRLLLHSLGEIPMFLYRNKIDKKYIIVNMITLGNT